MITIQVELSSAVEELAQAIQDRGRARMLALGVGVREVAQREAVRDTGAMAEGIYVAGSTATDYDERANLAGSLNATAFILPEAIPEDEDTVFICPCVHYAEEVEYGTGRSRNKGPRPFMLPAAESFEFGGAEELFADLLEA